MRKAVFDALRPPFSQPPDLTVTSDKLSEDGIPHKPMMSDLGKNYGK